MSSFSEGQQKWWDCYHWYFVKEGDNVYVFIKDSNFSTSNSSKQGTRWTFRRSTDDPHEEYGAVSKIEPYKQDNDEENKQLLKIHFQPDAQRPRIVPLDCFTDGSTFSRSIGYSNYDAEEFCKAYLEQLGNVNEGTASTDSRPAASNSTRGVTSTEKGTSKTTAGSKSTSVEPVKGTNKRTSGSKSTSVEPLKKRIKEKDLEDKSPIDDFVNKEISGKILGDFAINVENLQIDCNHQVRPLHSDYVGVIKGKFKKFPLQTYQMVIVMVATINEKEEFKAANVNGYKYYVLGGQHNVAATKELHRENPHENAFKARLCRVYAPLSRDTWQYLAQTHNDVIQHDLTLKEEIELCRGVHLKLKNTEEFDEAMDLYLIGKPPKTVKTLSHLARLSDENYDLLMQAFEANQLGNVKDQRKSKKGSYSSMMLYWFRPIEHLNQETIAMLLKQINNKELSWSEFQAEANIQKKLQRIQQAFVRYLGVETWAEVQKTIPKRSSREELEKLIDVKWESNNSLNTPSKIIQAVKRAKEEADAPNKDAQVVPDIYVGDTKGYFFKLDLETVDCRTWEERVPPDFTGFDLVILDMPQGASSTMLKPFLEGVVAFNRSLHNKLYKVVLITKKPEQMEEMVSAVKRTGQFARVERAFFMIEDAKYEPGQAFVPSVGGIVIAMENEDAIVCMGIWLEEELHCNQSGQTIQMGRGGC